MLSQHEKKRGPDHERGMATKRWFEDLFEKGVNANVLSGASSVSCTRSIVQRPVKETEKAQIRAAEKEWRREKRMVERLSLHSLPAVKMVCRGISARAPRGHKAFIKDVVMTREFLCVVSKSNESFTITSVPAPFLFAFVFPFALLFITTHILLTCFFFRKCLSSENHFAVYRRTCSCRRFPISSSTTESPLSYFAFASAIP